MGSSLLFRAVGAFCIIFVLSAVSMADPPQTIGYQGRLLSSSGEPVSGTLSITFRIFDSAEGGNELWSETHSSVNVDEGYFDVTLGEVFSYPFEDLKDEPALFLEIQVGSDQPLSPRTKLSSVPYAMEAKTMPGFDPGQNNVVSGSHVLVSGDSNQVLSDYSTIAGGKNNLVDIQNFADTTLDTTDLFNDFPPGETFTNQLDPLQLNVSGFLGGGGFNTATGFWSVVVGGGYNHAYCAYSALVGGYDNYTGGSFSFIGGGYRNNIASPTGCGCGSYSVINGGALNRLEGRFSVIGGGILNGMNDCYIAKTIAGGYGNQALNHVSTIGGGYRNKVDGFAASIGGGQFNNVQADNATIGGGQRNIVTGNASTVAGGDSNEVQGLYSTIAGGKSNKAYAHNFQFIGGGQNNLANNPFGVIGGGQDNIVSTWATIGGGIANNANNELTFIGGGTENSTNGHAAAIAGGRNNHADGWTSVATGGEGNVAFGSHSFIGGGFGNTVNGDSSVIAGGKSNTVFTLLSTIGGGIGNFVEGDTAVVAGGGGNFAANDLTTISGGVRNTAFGYAGTVPGGIGNEATGNHSFAFGSNAKADDSCSLVWSDCCDALGIPFVTPFRSYGPRSANFRTTGGFYIATDCDTVFDPAASVGVYLPAGGSMWMAGSSRNIKTDIDRIDDEEILKKLAELDIYEWSYKQQDGDVRHIGPMAEDFYSVFNIGENERTIGTLDPSGVALAAIRALDKKTQEIDDLKAELAEMKALLNELAAERR